MTSRFISAGGEDVVTPENDQWKNARQNVEAQRLAKQKSETSQSDGKSLYEALQANKAAKEDAFQESIKLKNQYRALDEGDIEFLDSIRDSERAKDSQVRQETAESLDEFRKQRNAAEQARLEHERETSLQGANERETESWVLKRKRRRPSDMNSSSRPAIKVNKISSPEKPEIDETSLAAKDAATKTPNDDVARKKELQDQQAPSKLIGPAKEQPNLGLGAYDSDDD